jgi:hypothetical protein
VHVRRLLALAIALGAAAGLTAVVAVVRKPPASPPPTSRPARNADGTCRGVALAPGADLPRAVATSRVGTVYCLAAGTFRVARPIEPKRAMQLVGEGPGRTVLDGSQELSGWAPFTGSRAGRPVVGGGLWQAPGRLPPRPAPDRHCVTPGCGIAQDVFFDGHRLERAMRLADLTPGRFYESFPDNRVVVAADPTGHVVEQAVAPRIVSSRASGVRVADLSIGKAANAAQIGGLHAADGAAGWVLDNVEVFANHGTGAIVDGGTVRNSRFHHNGQLGLAGAGDGSRIVGNDIHDNNTAGYDPAWEAGGAKFGARANDMRVTANRVHDNRGPGLWCDISCYNWTVDHNSVVDNVDPDGDSGVGIFYEISYRCSIHDNFVSGNGPRAGGKSFYHGGQIVIAASSDCDVHDNMVIGANGVGALQQDRHSGNRGPLQVRNLSVRHNVMVQTAPAGEGAVTGLVQDVADDRYFTERNNRWVGNTYHLPNRTGAYFDWSNRLVTQAAWERFGQDRGA